MADNDTVTKKSAAKPPRTERVERRVERDLIIKSLDETVEIALLEDGRLVELHHEQLDSQFTVGDIFLGRIRKLNPGLNAAFVGIGHEKDAFLHYTDLGPQLNSMIKYANGAVNGSFKTSKLDNFKREADIDKGGKIAAVLKPKQDLLFQISKEPISTKGPRLTAEINLPGRFMVLTPFGKTVNVSKKIGSAEERKRLKELVTSIRPASCGVIVRTAAEGKGAEELMEEMNYLTNQWDDIFKQLHKAKAPAKLLSELDKTSSLLRDLLSDDFNRVVTDSEEMYDTLHTYLEAIAPDRLDIIKLHKSQRDIFEANGIKRQIQASFGKTVTIQSGAYLVIEGTEAMHVVDVNSGNKMGRNHDEALLKVNMDSAREIARQLRLRDIGGLIVIDFIDMKSADHRQLLHREMRKFMDGDRAQHTVLPLSKFGLMQITRQRVRPALKLSTAETCPSCNGTGEVNPTELVTDDIERDLVNLLNSRPKSKLVLHVHPFVEAFLSKGFPNHQMRWLWRHQTWLRLVARDELGLTEYTFFDQNGEEIRLAEV
ncbi:MAG: Rne/Rng family ribonuclease [Saprospiraceae bacterium]